MRLLITGFLMLSLFLLPKGALAAQHGRVFSRLTETGSVNFRDYKNYYSTKSLAILGLASEAGGLLEKTLRRPQTQGMVSGLARRDTTDDICNDAECFGRGLIADACFLGAAIRAGGYPRNPGRPDGGGVG